MIREPPADRAFATRAYPSSGTGRQALRQAALYLARVASFVDQVFLPSKLKALDKQSSNSRYRTIKIH